MPFSSLWFERLKLKHLTCMFMLKNRNRQKQSQSQASTGSKINTTNKSAACSKLARVQSTTHSSRAWNEKIRWGRSVNSIVSHSRSYTAGVDRCEFHFPWYKSEFISLYDDSESSLSCVACRYIRRMLRACKILRWKILAIIEIDVMLMLTRLAGDELDLRRKKKLMMLLKSYKTNDEGEPKSKSFTMEKF